MMMIVVISLMLLIASGVNGVPKPQSVTAEDILKGAADGPRYSTNEEVVDQGLLDDVFGSSNGNDDNYNAPISTVKEIVDTASDSCSYYADKGYECVEYYQCEDGEIITDGGGLIDIRSGFGATSQLDPATSKCPGYLEVCCRNPNFATEPPAPPRPIPYTSQCGTRNRNGINVRIQNGVQEGTTQFGEWPHMCAVLEKKSIAGGEIINLYVCGASLIAPGIVLTGAHCVAKLQAADTKVRCGEWDTQQVIEPVEHEDRDVARIAIHPLFNPRNLQHDFALLYLTEDFILSPHIDTICLPNNGAGTLSYNPRDCVATGWGKDKFGKEGEYQVVMKQVEMDLVGNGECERRLRRTRLGSRFNLHDSFICAGGEADKDTCKGDGGGPLVCPVLGQGAGLPTRYVQAGIVAWGIDCGVDGNPGVYANVADALCFIDWATDCVNGNAAQTFAIGGCRNWASREKQNLENLISSSQRRLDSITRSGGTPGNIRNLERRIRKYEETLAGFTRIEDTCIFRDNDDLVDPYGVDDDTDLSGLARTGQNEEEDGQEEESAAGDSR